MKSSNYWKPLKTWKLKITRLQDFIPDQLQFILHSVVLFYKKLSLLYWTLLNLRCGSIAIRYASYLFQNRSIPTLLCYENHAKKNIFQWKQTAYPIWKMELSHSDPVWWKHSINFIHKNYLPLKWMCKCLYNKLISCRWSLSVPPENIQKPLVFCFQWVQKETSGIKWAKNWSLC